MCFVLNLVPESCYSLFFTFPLELFLQIPLPSASLSHRANIKLQTVSLMTLIYYGHDSRCFLASVSTSQSEELCTKSAPSLGPGILTGTTPHCPQKGWNVPVPLDSGKFHHPFSSHLPLFQFHSIFLSAFLPLSSYTYFQQSCHQDFLLWWSPIFFPPCSISDIDNNSLGSQVAA